MPKDYKRVLDVMREAEAARHREDETLAAGHGGGAWVTSPGS